MRGMAILVVLSAVMTSTASAGDGEVAHVDRLTYGGYVGAATALNEYDDLEQSLGPIIGARLGYAYPIGAGWLEPGFSVHHVRPAMDDTFVEKVLHNTTALIDVRVGAPWGRAQLHGRLGFGATYYYLHQYGDTESSFRFGTVMAAVGVDVLAFGNTSIGAEMFYEGFQRPEEYDGMAEQAGVSLTMRWSR